MRSISSRSYTVYNLIDVINSPDLYPEFKRIYKQEIEECLKQEKKKWKDLESHWLGRDKLIQKLDVYIFGKRGHFVFDILDNLSFNVSFDEIFEWNEEEAFTDIDIRRIEPRDKEELLNFIVKYWDKFELTEEELEKKLFEHKL